VTCGIGIKQKETPMNAIVKTITPGSPAAKKKIAPGDALCKINGETIADVLDYEFQS